MVLLTSLPSDALLIVVSYLPIKGLVRLLQVCTHFYSITKGVELPSVASRFVDLQNLTAAILREAHMDIHSCGDGGPT